MANKEMTRAAALVFAMELIENTSDAPEYVAAHEVLAKMHAQIIKPRKKSDAPSKARILNESLAAKCYEAMEDKEGVTTKWLIEHVNGIMTPQKCTAVMRILVDDGKVIRNKEGKAVIYTRA